jgi:hypothetical protein
METSNQLLQKLSKEERVTALTSRVSTIGVLECVKGTCLRDHEYRPEYTLIIAKHFSKLFFLHGITFNDTKIEAFTEYITEKYKYETPETIISFLKKASNGDFGKFYGEPDVGTISEWFADFLQEAIIPARERLHQQNSRAESKADERGQARSLREYIEGSRKTGAVNIPGRFKGKQRQIKPL